MVIFRLKQWVNPFGKISIFRLFELLFFCSLERRFFVLEYHRTHFPGLYWVQKKLEKWPFLDQNHGLTPLEKCQFFDFFNFLFIQPRQAFIRSRISYNSFSQSMLRKKKRVGKMANFGRKPWVNPFGKMSIFRLFELLVFITQTGVFSFQNIIEYISLAYIS